MTKKSHVLIVEDEKKLASLLTDYLTVSEYDTSCVHDGLAVEPWLAEHHTDVILLDLMLLLVLKKLLLELRPCYDGSKGQALHQRFLCHLALTPTGWLWQ